MARNHLSDATKAYIKHMALNGGGMELADFEALETAVTFQDLYVIAKRIIDRLGTCGVAIGPMSSGNNRSFEENILEFVRWYDWIRAGSHANLFRTDRVFLQIAFEGAIGRIFDARLGLSTGYNALDLFDKGVFYEPILTHPNIVDIWMLPGWEKSTGARMEYGIIRTNDLGEKLYHPMMHLVPEKEPLHV